MYVVEIEILINEKRGDSDDVDDDGMCMQLRYCLTQSLRYRTLQHINLFNLI